MLYREPVPEVRSESAAAGSRKQLRRRQLQLQYLTTAPPHLTARFVPQEVSRLTLEVPPAALECMPHMSAFFNSPLLSDVLLESGDEQTFHCHRLLLAAWSQPLCIMLTGGKAPLLPARDRP
jgi:hypothetical protein